MPISIVIPFYNERDGVDPFMKELLAVRPGDEIIAVDDGSTDGTKVALEKYPIKVISYEMNRGQSFATWKGLLNAQNDICVIMDGDGEIDPKDIERLVVAMKDCDICCGYRVSRKCSAFRILISKTANAARRLWLGDSFIDAGAMKAIKKADIYSLPLFDGLHRYIPSLIEKSGRKASQIPLAARARFAGRSKYGIAKRVFNGAFDLIGVKWLLIRRSNHKKAP